jgi:hypothetical protein
MTWVLLAVAVALAVATRAFTQGRADIWLERSVDQTQIARARARAKETQRVARRLAADSQQ